MNNYEATATLSTFLGYFFYKKYIFKRISRFLLVAGLLGWLIKKKLSREIIKELKDKLSPLS